MNVNELLDTIEDALEESAGMPLSGGKRIVDVEQIRDLLDEIRVGYLHIAGADWEDAPVMPVACKEALRMIYRGTLIYAGKYTAEKAEAALQAGWADLIGFGRPFIANPDLPHRLQQGLALNTPDGSRFFGGGAQRLTDYPWAEAVAA